MKEKLEPFWEEIQKANFSQAVFKKVAQDEMPKAVDSQLIFLHLDFSVVSSNSDTGNWNVYSRGNNYNKCKLKTCYCCSSSYTIFTKFIQVEGLLM